MSHRDPFTITDSAGVKIPCRQWQASDPKSAIVFVHGIQSHSGWFDEACCFLSERGHTCYGFDRRGAGISEQPRGYIDSYRTWIEELTTVLQFAESESEGRPVHLLSWCFGAKVALGYLLSTRENSLASAIFLCPGIKTKTQLRWRQMLRVLVGSKSPDATPMETPISDEMFTDVPEYLEFIHNDPHSLRKATPALYFQIFLLDRFLRKSSNKITLPLLFMLAGQDQIADNEYAVKFYAEACSQVKRLISYANVRHSLFFSTERQRVMDDLCLWLDHKEQ
ncbi:MAG TPA: alpha/beta fold hydrolase [bacterium]|nr:alpha/beta fold hydrolase [bacterium]